MFSRRTLHVWIGIVVLSAMFLIGQDTWPPPDPSVALIDPPEGMIGDEVRVHGRNFGLTQGSSTITFNGVNALPNYWSTTQITVNVPVGAETGPVIVDVQGRPSNSVLFTVVPNIFQTPTASPHAVYVNKPTIVTIRVRATPDENIDKNDVKLLNIDANGTEISVLGNLYDDGSHGDEQAFDWVFTNQFELLEGETQSLFFRVSATYLGSTDPVISESFSVNVIQNITQDEFDAIKASNTEAADMFYNQGIPTEDILEWLSDQPIVESASVDEEGQIHTIYEPGIESVLLLDPEPPSHTSDRLSDIKGKALGASDSAIEIGTPKALLLRIHDFPLFPSPMDNIRDILRGISSCIRADDVHYVNDPASFTVDHYKDLSEYGIIIIQTHGGVTEPSKNPFFVTGQICPMDGDNPEDYIDDLLEGRLIWASFKPEMLDIVYYYGITSKFIDYYGKLNNYNRSLVVMGSCHSYDNNKMADAFLRNNALAFIGVSGGLWPLDWDPFGETLFNYLVNHYYNVYDAGMMASAEVGATQFVLVPKMMNGLPIGYSLKLPVNQSENESPVLPDTFLLSPENNSPDEDREQIIFSWRPASDPEQGELKYVIVVNDSGGNTVYNGFDSGEYLSSCQFSLPHAGALPIQSHTTYSWAVWALDSCQNEANSEFWSFTTSGCLEDSHCDDGLWCNGEEFCLDQDCVQGTAPCNDDSQFCTGTEECDEENDICTATGNPCFDENECTHDICTEPDQCDNSCSATGISDLCCVDPTCSNDPACTVTAIPVGGSLVTGEVGLGDYVLHSFDVIADGSCYTITVTPTSGNPNLYVSRYWADVDDLSDILNWSATCSEGEEHCDQSLNPGQAVDMVTFQAPTGEPNYSSYVAVYGVEASEYSVKVESGTCEPVTVRIYEDKDTFYGTVYHEEGMPHHPELYVGGWGDWYYSYLEWDLSTAPPAEKTISCKMYIYCTYDRPNDPGVSVRRVTSPWTEEGVSRSNPPTDTVDGEVLMSHPTQGEYSVVDITDLYISWKNGTFNNYGVKLHSTPSSDSVHYLASEDAAGTSTDPYLEIVYTVGASQGDMVQIPAGCFDMGDHFNEGSSNELPIHNVCITAFEMDIHEVTISQYTECVNQDICASPGVKSINNEQFVKNNQKTIDYPVTLVDWHKASTFCAWAGKRLPTEAEWEYAARGGFTGYRYPWGNDIDCDNANYGRANSSSSCWDHDYLDNNIHPVGSYPPNEYGLFDMGGNVWEWVNDYLDPTYYQYCLDNDIVQDPPGPTTPASGVVRGGSWKSPEHEGRTAIRGMSGLSYENDGIGFRCARGGAFGP